MGVLEKLPPCMIVGVLVMIFACLKRHTRCARLTLWAVGWTLVFIHFLAQLLEPAGHGIPFLRAVDGGTLQFSAIAFLVSVSAVVEDRARRTLTLLALDSPVAIPSKVKPSSSYGNQKEEIEPQAQFQRTPLAQRLEDPQCSCRSGRS